MHINAIIAGPYRNSTQAIDALEHMFATGDVVEGEHPAIERRTSSFGDALGYRYYITVREYA